MVGYEQLYENEYPKHYVWIRPYDMFMSNVNHVELPRFTKVLKNSLLEAIE